MVATLRAISSARVSQSTRNRHVVSCDSVKALHAFLFFYPLFTLGLPCATFAQSSPAVSPQSLAGDWKYVLNAPLEMMLHLTVDANGTMTGSIDTPDTPPKHLELTNVHLAGNVLTYTMPPLGTIREVVMADGKKMAGPYLWERVTKTSVSSMQLAGDWTSEGPNAGGTILHLRSDKTGSLTGTLDVLGLSPFRQLLSKVSFDGNGLSFEGGNGSVFHGKINNEGKTLSGTFSQSSALITWQQIRNAAQAAAEDSKEKPRATDGAWNGVLNYTAKFPDLPLSKGKARLIFRFGSNPASCSAQLAGDTGTPETMPCQMTLTGNAVHVERVIGFNATFEGVLSPDAHHLSGVWTTGNPNFHWTGPVRVDLVRGE
jgi:hypothetical protein